MTHTQTQGADGAGTKTAATAWLLKRLKAARSDSEAHPEGHSNRTFYAGQAIAYENVLSLLEDEESTPAPAATPGVPDSLREAFAAATDSPVFVHDFADPAVSSAPGCQDISLSFVTPDHITAAFMGDGLAGTIAQARKDAVALAAAWNHVRALIAAQPAGQSEGRLSREREIVSTWDRDIAPGLDRLEAIARRMGAPVGTRLIHWAADKLEEFGGRPAGQSNPDLTDWRNAERAPLGKVRTVLLKDAQPAGQASDAGADVAEWKERLERAFYDAGGFHGQMVEYAARTALPVLLAAIKSAPNSTRTGAAETGDKLVRLLAAVSDRLRDNPPNGLVEGDLYVAAKNEGPDSGWRYVPTGLTVGDLDEARALIAARPEAPSDAGWRDIRTAPKDGTLLLLCVEGYTPALGGWFERRWLSFDPDSVDHDTLERWLSDSTYDPTHWRPLPTPPSDPAPSGQAEG